MISYSSDGNCLFMLGFIRRISRHFLFEEYESPNNSYSSSQLEFIERKPENKTIELSPTNLDSLDKSLIMTPDMKLPDHDEFVAKPQWMVEFELRKSRKPKQQINSTKAEISSN